MSKLKALQAASDKPSLAKVLNVDTVFLTRCLYIIRPENQYQTFTINKKSGGKRVIHAPTDKLKSLQTRLSILLLDCIDEINVNRYPNSQLSKNKFSNRKTPKIDYAAEVLKIKIPTANSKQPSLSHGFARKRSIITNAMMHIGKKNVLNIDLKDFFDSFNFGRVRGFFIKNNNFKLTPNIATVIAQIACYDNKLPQGSPCSPVITNLITHSLDIHLASLAKKYKCTYTRYADDITFSTRLADFPSQIMGENSDGYVAGKRLVNEIKRAGFLINNKKTRIQYKDSRQEVTGLIVNKKPNIKKEYWRLARAKCNQLFKTGKFTIIQDGKKVEGNINELEGQLNFIDQVDHYNRMRQKAPLPPEYALKKASINTRILLTGREKTFSEFLFYRLFCGNEKPIILCEGKTDNIYLKSAISELSNKYQLLASRENENYELLIQFLEYTKRTRFFMELFGGSSYLCEFIKKYEKNMKLYNNLKPKHPVIIFLDNDDGSDKVINSLLDGKFKKTITIVPSNVMNNGNDLTQNVPQKSKGKKNKDNKQEDLKNSIRSAEFIHVVKNLYVVLTPLSESGEKTDIEYFFYEETRLIKHINGKCFNTVKNRIPEDDLSKDAFASHIIKEKKKNINFDRFEPLLDAIVKVIKDYEAK